MSSAFVIQIHSGYGPLHYDLMLARPEAGMLATWRLPSPLDTLAVGESIVATELPDHPREYLTYAGPVSKGRGRVSIFDGGVCEVLACECDRWEVRLRGSGFRGRFELRRGDAPAAQWRLRRLAEE